MKSGYYWESTEEGRGGWGRVQTWSWLLSVRRNEERRLITNVIFDTSREPIWISHIGCRWPAGSQSSICMCDFSPCVFHSFFLVCTFNFLFQHIIVMALKHVTKLRCLSLFPHLQLLSGDKTHNLEKHISIWQTNYRHKQKKGKGKLLQGSTRFYYEVSFLILSLQHNINSTPPPPSTFLYTWPCLLGQSDKRDQFPLRPLWLWLTGRQSPGKHLLTWPEEPLAETIWSMTGRFPCFHLCLKKKNTSPSGGREAV